MADPEDQDATDRIAPSDQRFAAPPPVLGNYALLELIGRGGMGQVYKAVHRRMNRTVAVKVLPSEIAGDEQTLRRFQQEVVAAARLSHPNIVTAHDADEAQGVHFLVMEYVEGTDLRTWIQNHGPMPVAEAVRCVMQAARGLEYAHSRGVIHRDIKPANLLLAPDGTIKILDMGLARVELLPEWESRQAATGGGLGTLNFMAPEQAADLRRAGARADIYSLGCTLYFLLVGRPPYQARTAVEAVIAHREAPIPSLRSVRSDVSPALERVFARMLAKQPRDRYPSMAALIAALQACPEAAALTGAGADRAADSSWSGGPAAILLDDLPTTKVAPARLRWRRWRAVAAAGALTAVLLVLGSVYLIGTERRIEKNGPISSATTDVEPFSTPADETRPPAEDILPGLIPRPAAVAGLGRWQIETVQPRKDVLCLDWSPEGLLACGTAESQLRVYESRSWRPREILPGHLGKVTAVAWSPDGRWLASASQDPDHTIRLWQTDGTRGPILHDHGASIHSLAWRPDGQQFASADRNGVVRIWTRDGTPVRSINAHQGEASVLAWNPDGKWLASAGRDDTIRLWQADGTAGPVLRGHSDDVTALDWSPGGEWLASGSVDQSIRLWHPEGASGPVVSESTGGRVFALAWSPDGRHLASAGDSGTVRLWHPDGTAAGRLPGGDGQIVALAWSPEGDRIVAASRFADRVLSLWTADGRPLPSVAGYGRGVWSVAWAPDSRRFASGDDRGEVRLWDADGRLLRTLDAQAGSVQSVAWSPDGRWLASAGETAERPVRLWDPQGRPGPPLDSPSGTAYSVAWHPGGTRLSAGFGDGTIRQWTPDGVAGTEFRRHTEPVQAIDWNPDGRRLASGDGGGLLCLWQSDGTPLSSWRPNGPYVLSIAWSPDGDQLATAGRDLAVRLWRRDGTPGPVLKGHRWEVHAVAWSPDSRRLVSCAGDARVFFWKADGTPGPMLRHLERELRSVAWSRDGRLVLVGRYDGTVLGLDAARAEPLWVSVLLPDSQAATFTAAGELRHGPPDVIDREFVAVLELSPQRLDVLSLTEFQRLAGR